MDYEKLFDELINANRTKVRFNLDLTDPRLTEDLCVLEVKLKTLNRCHMYCKTIDSLISRMERSSNVFNVFPFGRKVSTEILVSLLKYLIDIELLTPDKVADCFVE